MIAAVALKGMVRRRTIRFSILSLETAGINAISKRSLAVFTLIVVVVLPAVPVVPSRRGAASPPLPRRIPECDRALRLAPSARWRCDMAWPAKIIRVFRAPIAGHGAISVDPVHHGIGEIRRQVQQREQGLEGLDLDCVLLVTVTRLFRLNLPCSSMMAPEYDRAIDGHAGKRPAPILRQVRHRWATSPCPAAGCHATSRCRRVRSCPPARARRRARFDRASPTAARA